MERHAFLADNACRSIVEEKTCVFSAENACDSIERHPFSIHGQNLAENACRSTERDVSAEDARLLSVGRHSFSDGNASRSTERHAVSAEMGSFS